MNEIEKILKNNNITNEELVYKKLKEHLNYVLEANKNINLTAITDKNKAKLLHIEDSLIPLHYILGVFSDDLPSDVKYADIGTGAGYPGVPIGIVTKFDATLIETTKKKADFLKGFIKECGYKNFYVVNDRIENVGRDCFEVYDLITARALSSLSSLLELASPICKIGGQLVCYKTTDCCQELVEAGQVEKIFGFRKVYEEDFVLSDGEITRKIIAYQKVSVASIKLPRKLGMAQKRPYKIK